MADSPTQEAVDRLRQHALWNTSNSETNPYRGVEANRLAYNRVADALAVCDERDRLLSAYTRMEAEVARLRTACSKLNAEVCDVLGRVLDYPWFKDDQKNFPGATETDGVCIGDHVAESIADEAAAKIVALKAEMAEARKLMKPFARAARGLSGANDVSDGVSLRLTGAAELLTHSDLRALAAFHNKGEE